MTNFENRNLTNPEIDAVQSNEGLLSRIEKIEEKLNLKEQYNSQLKILSDLNIVKNFSDADEQSSRGKGFVGVDDNKYFIPEYQDIIERLKNPEKLELIEKKIEQGFSKLLLVPLAMPISELFDRYKEAIIEASKNNELKNTKGDLMRINSTPLYSYKNFENADQENALDGESLEYDVKDYSGKTKESRGGFSKQEMISNGGAWQILLTEKSLDIPKLGDRVFVSDRKLFAGGESPMDYLDKMQNNPMYRGESGLTPESSIILYLTLLRENNIIMDNYNSGEGCINWLVGNFIKGDVPSVHWSSVPWDQLRFDRYYPFHKERPYGLRTDVKI